MLQTLIMTLCLCLVSLWFASLSLKAVDVLFRPRLNSWVRDKDLNVPMMMMTKDKNKGASKSDISEEYVKSLEEEVILLRKLLAERRHHQEWPRVDVDDDFCAVEDEAIVPCQETQETFVVGVCPIVDDFIVEQDASSCKMLSLYQVLKDYHH